MTDIKKLEAENARLRKRISDQKDALRFCEESCARLHRRSAEARRERDEALSRVSAEAGKDLAAWARDLDAAEAAHRYHGRVVAERNGWRMRAEDLASQLDEARRERDELKSRLAHAEADAEQAIHNEAFMERQRIVEWLRTASRARGVLISIHSSQDIARCADAIERGEHEQ